jgi:hypothetical protein
MPTPREPTARNTRSFTLNSGEAHDLLCRRERSMLPRLPRPERTPVIRDLSTPPSKDGRGRPELG